jgi:MFS family permease
VRDIPLSVWRLMLAYAFMMSGTSLNVLIAGIIGVKFAPSAGLATLPVALLIVGVALATLPTGKFLGRWGRRRVFVAYGLLAVVATLLAAYSLVISSFPTYCLSALMIGWSAAAGHQYRFAALEQAPAELAAKATSVLLLGGILAAFIGPELAVLGRNLVSTPFAGSYMLLVVAYVMGVILVSQVPDSIIEEKEHSEAIRSLSSIVKSPIVLLAICAAAVGYGTMSFLMTATPISMHEHSGHSLDWTKRVLQAHIIAMYLPSLFYPSLQSRFGHRNMLLAGVAAFMICVFFALAGTSVANYWWALVLLGIGWNFLFLSGTNILAFGYRSPERFRVQAMNDFLVFSIQAIVALSSGWFLFRFQWNGLLYAVMPLILAFLILAWRSKAYLDIETEKAARISIRNTL